MPTSHVAQDEQTKPTASRRPTRAEKAAATRQDLIEAAAEVVGDHGYADASVARITARANIAQGTFYNYFETRQALFDTLLPELGQDLIAFVGDRVRGSRDTLEMEERGFRAFFEYLAAHPGFYRILNEAETMAPKAHQKHFNALTTRYVAALKQGLDRGDLPAYAEGDLETVVYLLMAARSYLTLRYGLADGKLPEDVVATYIKFVRGALLQRAAGT
ncbi:MAG: TetR/AcrR family transcriptional regulator [Alphaproteobacteria bacterium]